MLVYGVTCTGFSLSLLDFASTGSFTSSRGFVCLGFAMFVYGLSCLDSLLLMLDFAHLGSIMLPHTFA